MGQCLFMAWFFFYLWPSIVFQFDQEFWLSTLVAVGDFQIISSLDDPGRPPHDLCPYQCIMLCSEVLPTKFGSLKWHFYAIWTLPDPCMTFNPALHYTLIRSSYRIWQPVEISKQLDLCLTWLTTAWNELQKTITLCSGLLPPKFG